MNKSNHLILALLITLLLGAANTGQALIISFTGVSDTATPIPGGTGTFLNFLGAPSLSAGNVAFVATGAGDQVGVYVLYPPSPVLPVADTSTAIPGGVGTFVSWPSGPVISGETVAFIGSGSGGQAGVYVLVPSAPIIPVADTSTPIPGGLAAFQYFTTLAMDSANNVAFVGGRAGNVDINPQQGVYKLVNGSLLKVADLTTAIPGATDNFSGFGSVAIDPGIVVFEGFDSDFRKGLYTDLGGTLSRVIAEGDTLGGKSVSALRFQHSGFSDGQAAFVAEFSDASQGVFLATLDQAPCPQSQGHWKNNPALWPVTSLTLGSQTYSKTELLAILKNSTSSDASIILARQLIAAKLNVANGSDPAPISNTIIHADSLLSGFAGKLPYKVKTNSATGKPMLNDATVLNNYNNNQLTPGCAP